MGIKFLKVSTIIMLLLLLVSLLVILSTNSLLILIAIGVGVLFLYYLIVYLLIIFYKNRYTKNGLLFLIWCLFTLPIIWFLLSPEGLFTFLTPHISLDMK